MDYQEIIAGSVGKENTFGTVNGQIKPAKMTYCRVATDDYCGKIKSYLGEAEVTDDKIESFGGYGVVKIQNFQGLLLHFFVHIYFHLLMHLTVVLQLYYPLTLLEPLLHETLLASLNHLMPLTEGLLFFAHQFFLMHLLWKVVQYIPHHQVFLLIFQEHFLHGSFLLSMQQEI